MGNTDKFEKIADIYDTSERIRVAKLASDAIRERLNGERCGSAVDFGCGTGLVGMNLLEDFTDILFLDTSQNMINQIEQKIADHKILNAATLCFDLEQDKPVELRADCIFMVQVLLHIKDTEAILSKLYKMLNPGGRLLIVDFDTNESVATDMVHNGFDQAGLAALMARIGYQNIQSRTFYSGSKLLMGQDASMFILDSQKEGELHGAILLQ